MVSLGLTSILRNFGNEYPTSDKIKWAYVQDGGKLATLPTWMTHILWGGIWSFEVGSQWDDRSWYTYPALIRKAMDKLREFKDLNWTHANYLGEDETYSPTTMLGWNWLPWSKFNIEGEAVLPNGKVFKALKPWYIATYGSWNQAWWDGVKANNSYRDEKLLKWNFEEWLPKVYGAWDDLCTELGKKSSHIGFISTDPQSANANSLNWNWGSYLPTFCAKCDAIMVYAFPQTISAAIASRPVAQLCRTYIKKNMIWLTVCQWNQFPESARSYDLQFEDYKTGISGNADCIMMTVSTDMGYSRPSIFEPAEPRLLEYCASTNTCPTSTPCVSNWQCEIPLNGYEKDGCGNRRTNPACNPCVPNWQCEIPLNGYEKDGCGNRRTNPACNPVPGCVPNWQCESPLNGYEKDGCGNRRTNSACNPVPGCVPNWQCELPLNGYEMDGCGNRRMNLNCNPLSPEEIRKKLKELFPFLPQVQLPKGTFFAFTKK